MRNLCAFILLFSSFVFTACGASFKSENGERILQRVKRDDELNVDNYFEQFGYLAKPAEGVQHSDASRREAIRNFQRFAHIPVTGELDKRTIKQFAAPRCGLPDLVPKGAQSDPRAPLGFQARGYKWKKKSLTWRSFNYSPDMPAGSQRRAFFQAFKHWSDAADINFRESSADSPDIKIKFVHGDHGDGYPFDRLGGTLAHAFYPENGNAHFDEAEEWTEGTDRGSNLMIVAAHEFGHSLGLDHSNVEGALMAPFYQGYDPKFKLHSDDIRGIQSLYGPKRRNPVTTTPRTHTTKRKPKPNPKPNSCTSKFDAVLTAHDGITYAFFYNWIWRFNSRGVDAGFPKLARLVFDYPPYNIGATAHSSSTRKTYFFKGRAVWTYVGYKKQKRTRLSYACPRFPHAALEAHNRRIYIFDGAYVWMFDEANMTCYGKQLITRRFPGLPTNIESATKGPYPYLYFFKGSKYRKYNDQSSQVVRGYPKDKAPAWMGCGRYVPK